VSGLPDEPDLDNASGGKGGLELIPLCGWHRGFLFFAT
jgi:hypothetical protein